ncbi:MAG: TetR/AcrR family transcriptional regulator [Chloroflexi bacterium]|nr:TetR/AcrR family transcriptional regulator [Chloroflexota bacterium]
MPELHPRIARSRQKLADAIIALALEHGYENVSIVAVTRLSGVGYTTFFRHYKSLDDLLLDILASHFTALSELVAQQPTIYDEAVMLYTFVRDNADLHRLYFELPATHAAAEYISAKCSRLIEARCEPRTDTTVPFKIALKYIFQTCQLLMLTYLDNLHQYTPEQVAAMHVDLVVKGATSAAVKLRQGWLVEPLAYNPEQTAISGTRSSPFSYIAMDALHPRVARSRQKLADALVSLALERSYENVSVQALTDKANVGYTTFYRHYKALTH